MVQGGVTRRLAAIVAADVAGYSRLIAADEEGTFAALRAHRRDLIDPKIAEYRGRIANTAGDSILIEFPSVVDALRCVLEVQRGMAKRNAEAPEDRRIEFRVGINLGDVIEQDGDLLGDGVNVAARLEALAEPGGICLSRAARDQVRDRMEIALEDMGEVEVKNLVRPVRVFRVLADGGAPAAARRRPSGKKLLAATAVLLLIAVVGGGLWWWQQRPDFEPADRGKFAHELPEEPSIAVLPFDNLTGDTTQDYLGDGLTENIIAVLSTSPNLFVISRNSAFTYKGKAAKVQQIAEQLGVRYVLEGSVQQAGDKLRVTAQLIDALDGRHLWAERYDRELKDLFQVQDEITGHIQQELQVKLTLGEQARALRELAADSESMRLFLQGRKHQVAGTKEEHVQADRLYRQLYARAPDNTLALLAMAWLYQQKAHFGIDGSAAENFAKSREFAEKSIARQDTGGARALLATLDLFAGSYDTAIENADRAVELSPSDGIAVSVAGWVKVSSDQVREGMELLKRAMRLEPYYPEWVLGVLAWGHILLGEYASARDIDSALFSSDKSSAQARFFAPTRLAEVAVHEGDLEGARRIVRQMLELNPTANLKYLQLRTRYVRNKDYLARRDEALRRAGMPEEAPLPLPDKPSIAVLPFANLSGDPEQDYLADGLTENIITALSKVPDMFVIARNSTFTYKGTAVKVQQVAREMGVRYVLEGSVQQTGDAIRVTAQLVDAVEGHHLWSERYDRKLANLFELQDDITLRIASALRANLSDGELARLKYSPTDNLRAWGKLVTGVSFLRRFTKEDMAKARELFQEAIELDPKYVFAWTMLGWSHWNDARSGWSESRERSFEMSMSAAQQALALDPDDSSAHSLLGSLYLLRGEHDKAIAEGRKAIALAPSISEHHAVLAISTCYAGEFEETVALTKQAMRLHPRYPAWYSYRIGVAYMMLGQHEDAITALKDWHNANPNQASRKLSLAIAYSMAGRLEEARELVKQALAADPSYNLKRAAGRHYFKDPKHLERIIGALRKAGLPD